MKIEKLLEKIEARKLVIWVLSIDIVIIIFHLLWGKGNDFLNLDNEYNLPAGYSATKLILVGVVALFIFSALKKKEIGKKKIKLYAWLFFAALFVYLGFDEFFTIHETTAEYLMPTLLTNLSWFTNYVFYWTILFLPLIFLALYLLYYFIKNIVADNPLVKKLFIVGTIFFILVIITEVLGGFMGDSSRYFMLITFEESFEFFGVTSFLIGSVVYFVSLEEK